MYQDHDGNHIPEVDGSAYMKQQYISYPLRASELSVKKKAKYDKGDKIILPYDMITRYICIKTDVFVLKLTNPRNNIIAYAGVLDFTAPRRVAYVPSSIFNDLALNDSDRLNTYHCKLPACTSVTMLAPKEFTDPVSVLEYLLTGHTVLYNDKKITIQIFDMKFTFTVTKVEPESPALLTNSDIKLNITQDE